MKNLPKYWVVERTKENTVLFRKTVIPYLRNTYRKSWNGTSYKYYGFDGSKVFKGTNCHNNLKCFKNNPILLTLDEFIKLTTKEETMIDFKIKGTKLPNMNNIEFKCFHWRDGKYRQLYSNRQLVSFGYEVIKGVVHILAEEADYELDNYYMLKESDVIEAAKKQGMYKEEFVLPEKWFLRFNTIEIFNKLCKPFKPEFIFYEDAGICNDSIRPALGNYYYLYRPATYGQEITFEQFKKYVLKQKEEVMVNIKNSLPENYIVKCDKNKEYCRNVYSYYYDDDFKPSEWLYIVCSTLIDVEPFKRTTGIYNAAYTIMDELESLPASLKALPVFTYDDYLKLRDNKVMEKQIIGYKLKKDCQQYLDAAEAIATKDSGVDFKIGNNLEYYLQKPEWGTYKKRLEETGVLDLWFEPVYEEVYKYKVGDWVVVLPEDPYYSNCEQGCAQQIADIDFNRNLPYRLRFSNKSTNEYSKIRLAIPEEIKKATTKKFPIGKYTAVVKNGKIIIDAKGEVSIKLFNRFFENYLTHTLTELDGFKVYLTDATINVGCVENVTLAQARELYNYTKTL